MAKKSVDTRTVAKESLPAPRAADSVPDYLQDVKAGSFLHGVGQEDIALPSIRLLQDMSEVVKTRDDAKPGTWWHTGFDVSLGPSFEFVIAANRKKYLLMAPISDTRRVLARADDGVHWNPPTGSFEVRLKNVKQPVVWTLKPTVAESGLAEYGTYNPNDPESPPAAVLVYEHLVILPDHLDLGPAFLSFARSQIKKVRRELYPKIAIHNSAGRPMQALCFLASAIEEKGAEGLYYNVTFRSAGWASKELFELACQWSKHFERIRPQDDYSDHAPRERDEADDGAF
jgi:hypothetical protein